MFTFSITVGKGPLASDHANLMLISLLPDTVCGIGYYLIICVRSSADAGPFVVISIVRTVHMAKTALLASRQSSGLLPQAQNNSENDRLK